jgi:muramidase (phage lysozyme)
MAGTSEVLQEYVVKLGFVVDQLNMKRMFAGLDGAASKILKLGSVTAGMVVATEAAVAAFAYSMRKMYFAAELSDTTVKNMNALAFAGKQVGISAEAMGAAVHNVAQNLRLNPGLVAFAKSLGVKVEGRDVSDVMLDLVGATKEMPEYIGAQQMALFGIDPDTYHQMRSHLDELLEKKKQNLDFFAKYGIDIDAQKKTMLEYTEGLDNLQEHLKVLGYTMANNLLPAFKWFNAELMKDIDWWSGVHIRSLDDAIKNLKATLNYEPAKLVKDERYGPDGKLLPKYQAQIDELDKKSKSKPLGTTWLPGERETYEKFQARLNARLSHSNLTPEEAFDAKLKDRLTIGKGKPNSDLKNAIDNTKTNPDGSVSLANTAFGKLIARGEGDYNSVNLGKAGGYKSSTADLENMTVDDVLIAQQKGKFNAAGRYQITKDVMVNAVNALNLTGKEKFDQRLQDRIFEQYLAGSKRPEIANYLKGKSDDIDAAIKAASREWASVADPTTGKSVYEGIGNNKASISVDEMRRALQESRNEMLNMKLGDAPQGKPPVTQNNDVTFNIYGNNARDVADEVQMRQTRIYGDALRDLVGAQVS